MKITNEIADMIFDLEYILGNECYNPNSYDGFTEEEGRSYRYPVKVYPNEDADEAVNYRGKVNASKYYPHVEAEMIPYMHYKFGSNQLYVGSGIIKMLEELERRYGLDFNELENELRKDNGTK